jgi:ankyrin repeat protein
VDGSSVIQFAHFSVKEYLSSNRLAESKDTLSRFHISMTPAHTIVAQACLGVLLHMDESITEDDLERFPLASYAAEHWVGHARFQDVSPKIEDGMKRLFDPDNHHLSVWVWIHDPDPVIRDSRSKRLSRAKATPLHYAAACGLHDIAQFLIVQRSQNVNARELRRGETPLGTASRRGHPDVARVLLEHGTDTETRDNGSKSPLEWASQRRHLEVVQVLLEHHVDVDSSNKALHWASVYGHVAIARVLLASGADANAKTGNSQTPLHRAKNDGVARALLEYGADPNARDNEDRTPLHVAMEWNAAKTARVLVDEKGVDASARNFKNQTPLHVASEAGYLDGVRLLLQHNADIHARDDKGRTPFQAASKSAIVSFKERQDIMQLLLQHGAEDHRT